MAQQVPLPLTVSCFSKIQIGFTFLVPAHPGSPRQRAVERACVWLLATPPRHHTFNTCLQWCAAQLTEWREESFLDHVVVLPEPAALVAALRPQAAVWVVSDRRVARQIDTVLGVGVFALLIGGGGQVRQPIGREEADADEDDGRREGDGAADEQAVGARHPAASRHDAHLHTRRREIMIYYASWQHKLTTSLAIAEGPRDASRQLISCRLPRNSAETTCTTSPEPSISCR